MTLIEVKVLKPGYTLDVGNNQIRADGTITLVKGAKNLIVDTGSPHDREIILDCLNGEGLGTGDIDYVVCTHGHCDHVGNNNLFREAVFIVCRDISRGDLYTVYDFSGGPYIIAAGISVIATPGHTSQDVSVIVDASIGTVAVVGDLFECEDDIRDESLWRRCSEDPALQHQSRQRVLQVADYIVPGHGPMFAVCNTWVFF
ncbi:MAG: MBL fold metallo-hydrolase [Nitrospirae bacterium]|uniref:MBL fold metallo-hydrolase n=1 Tax=Candidatus Magnetobacterium casense TaxID=1455061 RepID=UPI000590EFA4|nr:MBL fold metallo-hydrolase [Candidatus Magnetobacterium casensis]MBF0336635.1 MBL fold metallo-hydrolase [Nitrospirota bacterium]